LVDANVEDAGLSLLTFEALCTCRTGSNGKAVGWLVARGDDRCLVSVAKLVLEEVQFLRQDAVATLDLHSFVLHVHMEQAKIDGRAWCSRRLAASNSAVSSRCFSSSTRVVDYHGTAQTNKQTNRREGNPEAQPHAAARLCVWRKQRPADLASQQVVPEGRCYLGRWADRHVQTTCGRRLLQDGAFRTELLATDQDLFKLQSEDPP
jgi:hypothetical protein